MRFPDRIVRFMSERPCQCQRSALDVYHNRHGPSCFVGMTQAYIGRPVSWAFNGRPVDPPTIGRRECVWTSDDNGLWHTECGETHESFGGGPADNGQRFCGYCGLELIEKQHD